MQILVSGADQAGGQSMLCILFCSVVYFLCPCVPLSGICDDRVGGLEASKSALQASPQETLKNINARPTPRSSDLIGPQGEEKA